MSAPRSTLAVSTKLRLSLKRGLARQAFMHADILPANLPRLIDMAQDLRPNRKALDRLGARFLKMPGVVRVRVSPGARGLSVVARCPRGVVTCANGVEMFREESVLYILMKIGLEAGRVRFGFCALGFCLHAIERFVERSDLPLEPILPALDAEALAAFGQLSAEAVIEDREEHFLRASMPGVWAVSPDRMALDPDWGLQSPAVTGIPLYSVRTFLGPNEMRPTLWLRWRDDPACQITAAA